MMTLRIISAEQIDFEGKVSQVTLPGMMGSFQVLQNHAAMIAALKAGTVSYTADDGSTQTREITGGVADVKDNVIEVCLY